MYLNTNYIDAFKYFSKYPQNVDLFDPLTFLNELYIRQNI